jgi:hypothetical protein
MASQIGIAGSARRKVTRGESCFVTRITRVKIKEDEMGLHVARMGDKRKAYEFVVGKTEGKIPFGRPRCKWEYSITVAWKLWIAFI